MDIYSQLTTFYLNLQTKRSKVHITIQNALPFLGKTPMNFSTLNCRNITKFLENKTNKVKYIFPQYEIIYLQTIPFIDFNKTPYCNDKFTFSLLQHLHII